MPEITVTESQYERLEAIQGEIESAYIDTYGHIRTTDVVQYLLDTYTPPERQGDDARERIATAEFGALQAVATDVEGVPGSGIDTETMRGELLSALGVEAFAARLAEVEGDDAASAAEGDESSSDTPSAADADSDVADETDTGDEAASDAAEDETDTDAGTESDMPESDGPGAGTESDDSGGSTSTSAAASDRPGAVLSAANQLLTDHEDKWRKGGSDSPYEVDLPDGTTEQVRTKDDVRGLLFKHY